MFTSQRYNVKKKHSGKPIQLKVCLLNQTVAVTLEDDNIVHSVVHFSYVEIVFYLSLNKAYYAFQKFSLYYAPKIEITLKTDCFIRVYQDLLIVVIGK